MPPDLKYEKYFLTFYVVKMINALEYNWAKYQDCQDLVVKKKPKLNLCNRKTTCNISEFVFNGFSAQAQSGLKSPAGIQPVLIEALQQQGF